MQPTMRVLFSQGRRRGGGHVPPHFQKLGGTSVFVPPPHTLLDRANVLISLFAHILWLKTHFFLIFLARFARQLQLIIIFQTLLT